MTTESDIWLIKSKLHPSGPDIPLLRRRKLNKKTLSEGLARVILVSAPPGFGKTSFLSSLFHLIERKNANVAWLSLDEFDRDPEIFAAYVITALSEAGLDLGHLSKLAAEGFLGDNLDLVWQTLVGRIELEDKQTVIFLDDYHLAATQDIDKRLRFLISHMPADCHVVIGSREHPNVGVPRLFSQGKLQLIGPQSLKFDTDELDAFFNGSLDADLVNAVMERTEGWPVAVNLAKIWMENRRGITDLSNFSGSIGDIANYLTEEVFCGLSDDLQIFMMRTAFLERINGDVANEICGCQNSWEILEQLEKRNLFVIPIGQTRKWYRYHQLIREFLQDRYRRLYPEKIADLHRTAAQWSCDHLYVDEALRHAHKADDAAFPFALMEEAGGWQLGLTHGVPALKSICTLQNPDKRQFPRVELAHIYLALKESRIEEACVQFARLEDVTDDFENLSPNVPNEQEVRHDASIIGSFIDFYQDKEITPADLQTRFATMLETPELNPRLKALANNMISISAALQGDYERAIDVGLRALEANKNLNLKYGGMYLSIYLGLSYLEIAELRQALAFYEKISQEALESLGANNNIYTNSRIFCAEVHYLMNDCESAEKIISTSFDNAVHGEIYYNVLWSSYSTAAYVARHNEDKERALLLIRELRDLARQRQLERLFQIAEFREIDELVYWNELDDARDAINTASFQDFVRTEFRQPSRSIHAWLAAQKTYGRYLLATNDHARAYELLKSAAATAERLGQHLQGVSLKLLLCVAAARLGRHKEAASNITSAAAFALPRGVLRPFVDELKGHRDLLTSMTASMNELCPDARNAVTALLQSDTNKTHSKSNTLTITNRSGERQTITAREMDVLIRISDGLSNKEIAGQFQLSEATIKFHRRNLYQKFMVNSRSKLIEAANAQGVISRYKAI